MKEKLLAFIKRWWFDIIFCLIVFFIIKGVYACKEKKGSDMIPQETEWVDNKDKSYNKIYFDKEFSDLKKENKTLYDSLKKCKDKIDYLLEFKYEKSYSISKVETSTNESALEAKTFTYESEQNDTFEYKLRINADKEPYWYDLQAKVKDKVTIVNMKTENSDVNQLSIRTDSKADIGDVTTFNKKQKESFLKHFKVAPSATFGYDVINNKIGLVVGVGLQIEI